MQSIKEMFTEFEKGCSIAGPGRALTDLVDPVCCEECARAFIDALYRRLFNEEKT